MERDGLLVTGAVSLDIRDSSSCVMFSDGDNLGMICGAKDVRSFVFLNFDNLILSNIEIYIYFKGWFCCKNIKSIYKSSHDGK